MTKIVPKMNKYYYLLLIIPPFLMGLYVAHIQITQTLDMEELEDIRGLTMKENSRYNRTIFSEQYPPIFFKNDQAVQIHTSCDAPAAAIRFASILYDPTHISFRPIYFTNEEIIEHGWDITPCFSSREDKN
ncbi:MAG: hypothetical protein EB830_05175 [Nitrosopumilus sp. H13]|nr:MAG: hypothetical protein EB830_05175 [Nitrosopumilus sp. H13]